jgi:hypothetical protein
MKDLFYPYTFIALMVDHYSDLVDRARNDKELEVRLDGWFYWQSLLIAYKN